MLASILQVVHATLASIGVLGLGLSLALLAFFVTRFTRWSRLRHFPGPPLAGWSRFFWLVPYARSNQKHLELYEVNRKYGRLARIGPNRLLTSDWRLWKRILTVRSPYVKAGYFAGFRFDPRTDHIGSAVDEQEHNRLRSMMAHGYTGKEVEGVESKVDANLRCLFHLLETRYISLDKPFDFARKAQYLTTDVISHLAYGAPFGFLTTDSDVYQYLENMEAFLPVASFSTAFPSAIKMINWPILKRFAPSPEDTVGLGKLMGIAKAVAAERYGPDKKVHKDMLGSFVARGLTQAEAEAEILLQILAGSDTSATTIRASMLFIATNPRVLAKLQAEIDSVVPSLSGDDIIQDDTAQTLPYLFAIVKESMRLLPPAADHAPRQVPPEGDEWNGMKLPGGTEIGWNTWGMMRDPDVWGGDADQFRPERWLDPSVDPEKLKDMETVGDMVFGGGRWRCLGRNIALMEIRKVIFELFRRYGFEILNPMEPWKSYCWGLFEQHDFWLKAHLRNTE